MRRAVRAPCGAALASAAGLSSGRCRRRQVRRYDGRDNPAENELGEHADTSPSHFLRATAQPVFRRRYYSHVDRLTFVAKGGDGGMGGVYWMRYMNNQHAGPGGGSGGGGGAVLGQCTEQYTGLEHLYKEGFITYDPEVPDEPIGICTGGQGTSGDRWYMTGNSGIKVTMPLPVGTVVIDADTNREMLEFTRMGEVFEFAAGGVGGQGNTSLRNSIVRAPDYAELGTKGQAKTYTLELRTLADVAFVGAPNSGKSSLLGAMTRSAPQPASWSYATWKPMVGHVYPDEGSTFSIVDLPSVAPDAHLGEGRKGAEHLKHAHRVNSLIYVLDVTNHRADNASTYTPLDLAETLANLQDQLEFYKEGLSHRAVAIAVTKMDLLIDPITKRETWAKIAELQKKTNLPVFPVSTHSKQGVLDLLLYASKMTKKYQKDKADAEVERTRGLKRDAEDFDELRLAEAKQILVSRMQDLHMSRAIETLMEDRIKGRPNYGDGQASDVEMSRRRATASEGAPAAAADDVVLSLADVEKDSLDPFVLMGDIDDAVEAEAVTPEDWSVGSMDELRDEQRTTRPTQSELWSKAALHIDQEEDDERRDARALRETAEEYSEALNEIASRKEYGRDLLGVGSVEAVPNLDMTELANRSHERLTETRAAIDEARRIKRPDGAARIPLLGEAEAEEEPAQIASGAAAAAAGGAAAALQQESEHLLLGKVGEVQSVDEATERLLRLGDAQRKALEERREAPEYAERKAAVQAAEEERKDSFHDRDATPRPRRETVHPGEVAFRAVDVQSEAQASLREARFSKDDTREPKRVKGPNPFFRESAGSRAARGHSEEDLADLTARTREQLFPDTGKPAPGEGPKTG